MQQRSKALHHSAACTHLSRQMLSKTVGWLARVVGAHRMLFLKVRCMACSLHVQREHSTGEWQGERGPSRG